MRRRLILPTFALLVAGPLAAQTAAPSPAPVAGLDSATTMADGRKYTAWFYAGLGDSIIAHSSAQVREKITAAQVTDVQTQLLAQVGAEQTVVSEQVVPKDSLSGYLREARFELFDEPLVIVFTLGRTGLIYGFFIRPKSQMPTGPTK